MLLDKLLANLDIVDVEPFSLCEVSPGLSLRLPRAERVMLHFVLAGSGFVRLPSGEPKPLASCYLAVVPKGTSHALEGSSEVTETCDVDFAAEPPASARRSDASSGETPSLLVACGLVRVELASTIGVFDQLRDVLVEDLSDIPQVRSAFDGILAEERRGGPGSEAMKAALMSQCIVYLFRHICRDGTCSLPWLAALEDERLARVLERVLEGLGDPHTVKSLAGVASMSRSSFAESFTKAFDQPPMTLVRRMRLERARELLRQPDRPPIRAIARQVGFSSRSHFSREFKRHFGVSPVSLSTRPAER